MWRFLHNIPRALKNYHAPRATVGVIVDNDDKEQVTDLSQDNGNNSNKCVLLQTHQPASYYNVYNNDSHARAWVFLQGLLAQRHQNHARGNNDKSDVICSESDDKNLLHSYILRFLDGSAKQMLEALDVGPRRLCNKERTFKLNLLHNFLYSLCITCNKNEISLVLNVNKDRNYATEELPPALRGQTLCAIKDEKGSEHDRAINESKTETLEAALKDFEQMCVDYTAANESFLALSAADNGEMSEAVGHFRTACSMGNKSACFNLGLCYEIGTGVKINIDKAKYYYQLAALKGHVQAMYNLSLLYLNEDGKNNHGDLVKGIELMDQAAIAGLSQAQTHMGLYYMQEVEDAKKAVAYFKAAADQNDHEAQYFLALCYEYGQGVQVNECWAAYLYSSAANAGNDCAMFNLARFHENGLGGIPIDVSSAHELYTKAASLGNKEAEIRLKELSAIKSRNERSKKETMEQRHKPTVKIKSSCSSPNLGEHLNSTVSGILYRKLYELLFYNSNSNIKNEKPMIESVGERRHTSFYIGEDEANVTVEKGHMIVSKDIGVTNGSYRFSLRPKNDSLHKSSPDLSYLVACSL